MEPWLQTQIGELLWWAVLFLKLQLFILAVTALATMLALTFGRER